MCKCGGTELITEDATGGIAWEQTCAYVRFIRVDLVEIFVAVNLCSDLLSTHCASHESQCLDCWWHSEPYRSFKDSGIVFSIGIRSWLDGWPSVDIHSKEECRNLQFFGETLHWYRGLFCVCCWQGQRIQYCSLFWSRCNTTYRHTLFSPNFWLRIMKWENNMNIHHAIYNPTAHLITGLWKMKEKLI